MTNRTELMDKENAFKKHKKAVIVIIILLVLPNLSRFNNLYQLGDALRNQPAFVIGLLIGNLLLFFVLFAIYYCVVQAFIKLRSKQVDKIKVKE